jgi:hypothetical protein
MMAILVALTLRAAVPVPDPLLSAAIGIPVPGLGSSDDALVRMVPASARVSGGASPDEPGWTTTEWRMAFTVGGAAAQAVSFVLDYHRITSISIWFDSKDGDEVSWEEMLRWLSATWGAPLSSGGASATWPHPAVTVDLHSSGAGPGGRRQQFLNIRRPLTQTNRPTQSR